MSLKKAILAVSALSVSFSANAALTSYTGAGGVGLVYSSVSDVTWTQDANLFKTLYNKDNTLISQIVNVSPTYNDSYWGLRSIDTNDFNPELGEMTWWGANAFVYYLNHISYGGSSLWRLPTQNGDYGFNRIGNGNEFSRLFYLELDGISGASLPKSDVFTNDQAVYWLGHFYLGQEFEPIPNNYAWLFYARDGFQGYFYKSESGIEFSQAFTWVVSPGLVSNVPLPAASWLMLTGLFGCIGFKRSKK